MSSPNTSARIPSDDEIVPESPLVTPPRSPIFMPISAGCTEEIEVFEEFNPPENEPESIEDKLEPPEAESQPTDTLPTPAEATDEVIALYLRLEQGEQRIAELERQVATMKNGKRKWEENPGRNSGQQQGKRQDSVKAYAAGPDVKKRYKGKKPHCNKCSRHHTGHCGTPCGNCKRYGHRTRDCRSTAPVINSVANPAANPGAPKACYECGGIGHFRRNCANLKNQNNNNKNNNNHQGKISRKASM